MATGMAILPHGSRGDRIAQTGAFRDGVAERGAKTVMRPAILSLRRISDFCGRRREAHCQTATGILTEILRRLRMAGLKVGVNIGTDCRNATLTTNDSPDAGFTFAMSRLIEDGDQQSAGR